ncbi:MAG: PilZ domain-containing protein [Planctomycetota bacterium]
MVDKHEATEATRRGAESAGRLRDAAESQGQPDRYTGKRSYVRFNAALHLDVSVDPADTPESWPVIMQNASGGGCAFWSKRWMAVGTQLLVRQFASDQDEAWAPGQVQHCTPGLRGFLVGVEFEDPIPPDEQVDGEPEESHTPAIEDGSAVEEPLRPQRKKWFTGRRNDD